MGQPPSVADTDPAVWVNSSQYTYTRDFPYLWEEITLPISYQADRAAAESVLLAAEAAHAVVDDPRAEAALRSMQAQYALSDASLALAVADHRQLAAALCALPGRAPWCAPGEGPDDPRHPRRPRSSRNLDRFGDLRSRRAARVPHLARLTLKDWCKKRATPRRPRIHRWPSRHPAGRCAPADWARFRLRRPG